MPASRVLTALLASAALAYALLTGVSADEGPSDGVAPSTAQVATSPDTPTQPQPENTEATPPVVSRTVGRSGFFERIAPRPLETPEELEARTKSLKEIYTKPSSEWPAPTVDEGVQWEELGLLPEAVHPESNPFTKQKAALGRVLFFDPRLSQSSEMACASCHDPDLAWADGRTVSFGLSRFELKRNAPSILNVGFNHTFFWDGRAASLEDQAEQVLMNPQEMNCSEELILERLSQLPAYRAAFEQVFGDPSINISRVAMAIACFERTLVGGRSPFDTFLQGKHQRFSDSAIRGLDVFRTTGRCMNCHSGPMLTDHKFHDIGLSYYGRKYEDLGRYLISNDKEDVGRFRTPTLRNVSRTRPYMHNGLFDLPNVLRMYNAGMPTLVAKEEQKDDPLFPKKSPHLRPLGLNAQDLDDLEEFLISLEEPRFRHRPPVLPQPGDLMPATAPVEQDAPEDE
ncbi:cytochrome-c peroxidase [Planctomicrobium sp. SH668]|uniref:cytochrome-c peroxidase n=1 Tax=Planctomicrobium sp. SH668 TaxID=3448126 RepID=UPI003F5CA983